MSQAANPRHKIPHRAGLLFACAACLSLTGCFGFLKPATTTARRFVLTSLPAEAANSASRATPAIGVGQVKLAGYLFDTSLAVRKGANEIVYLPSALWAERLDTGFQRALAVNLASLLPNHQIRLSTWRKADVAAEVYLAVEQFDVDTNGRGTLIAWWRILAPGGEKTLKAGEFRLTRDGSPPDPDPAGSVATLSEMLADFSRQLAQTLSEVAPAVR